MTASLIRVKSEYGIPAFSLVIPEFWKNIRNPPTPDEISKVGFLQIARNDHIKNNNDTKKIEILDFFTIKFPTSLNKDIRK